MRPRLWALAALGALLGALTAAPARAEAVGYYVSLGDSLAAGVQPTGAPPQQETELRALWDAMQTRFGTVLANRPGVVNFPVAKPERIVPSNVTK